jgi:hypothetical protein
MPPPSIILTQQPILNMTDSDSFGYRCVAMDPDIHRSPIWNFAPVVYQFETVSNHPFDNHQQF